MPNLVTRRVGAFGRRDGQRADDLPGRGRWRWRGGALNNAVEEVEEAVFSPAESRPTERIYRLSRQVLEFRRSGWL